MRLWERPQLLITATVLSLVANFVYGYDGLIAVMLIYFFIEVLINWEIVGLPLMVVISLVITACAQGFEYAILLAFFYGFLATVFR